MIDHYSSNEKFFKFVFSLVSIAYKRIVVLENIPTPLPGHLWKSSGR